MTFKELFQNSIKVSPSRRDPPSSASREVSKLIPYRTTNNLLMQFLHGGLTASGIHQVNVMFYGLGISEEAKSTETHILAGNLWVEKPDLALTRVKIRCTCPDFYFTFAFLELQKRVYFWEKAKSLRKEIPK